VQILICQWIFEILLSVYDIFDNGLCNNKILVGQRLVFLNDIIKSGFVVFEKCGEVTAPVLQRASSEAIVEVLTSALAMISLFYCGM
jgi:hypothetical protein